MSGKLVSKRREDTGQTGKEMVLFVVMFKLFLLTEKLTGFSGWYNKF